MSRSKILARALRRELAALARERLSQALDAGDFGDARQQIAQSPGPSVRTFAMVGIHVLTDEGNLAHASLSEPHNFVDNLCNRPRNLGSTRVSSIAADWITPMVD